MFREEGRAVMCILGTEERWGLGSHSACHLKNGREKIELPDFKDNFFSLFYLRLISFGESLLK